MKVSMSMIESRLSAYDTTVDISENERVIRGVRFLSEGQKERSSEYVYLGQASEFFNDPRYANALVLSNQRSSIVCRGSSYEDLLNDVIAVFDFFNDAEMRLVSLAAQCAPLANMLGVVQEMIPDALYVFGIDGVVLGKINETHMSQQDVLTCNAEQEKLRASAIGGYFKDDNGVVIHDLSEVPHTTTNSQGLFATCMYLYQDEEAVGFLMCFPSRKNDTALVEALEPVIANYVVQSTEFVSFSSPNQSRRRALAGLIDGVRASQNVEERIMEALGFPRVFQLVAAGCLSVQNRTQRMLLMEEIEEAGVPCLSCEVGEQVVFIVAASSTDLLVRHIAQRFDRKSAVVGVSMEAVGLDALPAAYRQAIFALQDSREPGVRYCKDRALSFLLETIRKEPAAQNLTHSALKILSAYDAENQTELLPTLQAYLQCGCSQSTAAKQLFVHLNTLKYRLHRIVELTGINFEDRDTVFFLELSFYIGNS